SGSVCRVIAREVCPAACIPEVETVSIAGNDSGPIGRPRQRPDLIYPSGRFRLLIVRVARDPQLFLSGNARDLYVALPRAGKAATIGGPGEISCKCVAGRIMGLSTLLVDMDLLRLPLPGHMVPDHERPIDVGGRDMLAIRRPGKGDSQGVVRDIPADSLTLASPGIPDEDGIVIR